MKCERCEGLGSDDECIIQEQFHHLLNDNGNQYLLLDKTEFHKYKPNED